MLCLVRKLFICLLLLFSFNSVVFAYEYNGEVVPTYSKRGDDFYGVETVVNILDEIGISYDDTSKVSYTYFINQTVKYYQNVFNDSTISSNNFIFFSNANGLLFMIPSNGSFSETLAYSYINIQNKYIKYVQNGTTPSVGNPPQDVGTFFTSINSNGIVQQATSSLYFRSDMTFTVTDNNLGINYLVAPVDTFSVYAGSPWRYYFLSHTFEFSEDLNPIPSGDDSGSGESGSVDLSGIQTGINNINNNLNNIENKIPTSGDIKETISGEVAKITETLTTVPDLSGEIITSGEIKEALNLDFMADPYDNFWYELTTGLSHALTDNVRQYDIPWVNGYVYTFNLDTWGLKFPPAIEFVLRSMSVIAITWVIVKYWKIIVDKISSGSIDEVLAMNEEEGIIDLF